MFFLVSLYLQSVLRYPPLAGGLALLPLSLVVVATAPQTGRLIARLGLRGTAVAGFALLCAGMLWLALALSSDGTFASTVLVPSLVLGAALPLVVVATNVAATADAGPEETGLASGLVNTSQQSRLRARPRRPRGRRHRPQRTRGDRPRPDHRLPCGAARRCRPRGGGRPALRTAAPALPRLPTPSEHGKFPPPAAAATPRQGRVGDPR